MSAARLTGAYQPESGVSARLIIGMPSRLSRPARSMTNWRMSGTIRMSTISCPISARPRSRSACDSRGSAKKTWAALWVRTSSGRSSIRPSRRAGGSPGHRGRRGVVDEPGDAQPELRQLRDLLRHGAAELAGADDDRLAHVVAAPAAHPHRDDDPGAADAGQQDARAPEEQEHDAREAVVAVEEGQRDQEERGERAGLGDREGLVDQGVLAVRVVEAVRPAGVEPQRQRDGEEGEVDARAGRCPW